MSKSKSKMEKWLIKNIKKKYQRYLEYMSDQEIKETLIQAIQQQKSKTKQQKNDNIEESILIMMEFDNIARYNLCQRAIHDVDLEILLIDEFTPFFNIMARKFLYHESTIKQMRENYLIEAIETYSGDISFHLYLTRLLRETIKPKKIDKKPSQNNWTSMLDTYIEKIKKRKSPSDFEILFHTLDIVHKIEIEDLNFKRFICLKYGFYYEIYFSNEQIQELLNLEDNQIHQYEIKSLKILNWFVNYYIDQAIEIEKKKVEQLQYQKN